MVIGIEVGTEVAVGAIVSDLKNISQVNALISQPVGVLIAIVNALVVGMAVPELAITIVHAGFFTIPGRGNVKLAREAAVVACIGEAFGDELYAFVGREVSIAVAIAVNSAGVEAC